MPITAPSPDPRRLGGTPEAPVRVDLPCAWYGKDLKDNDSWIWRIAPEHIEELDAALRRSKEKGLAEQEVRAEDFPIPGFAGELKRMIHELEYGRGFVLMPSACPYGRNLPERAFRNYEAMVEAVGA